LKWKTVLDAVGVTAYNLNDASTAVFVYNFVEKHGGTDEAFRKLTKVDQRENFAL